MCNPARDITIHGIPVKTDPSLSWEEIHNLVCEVVQAWTWEGRELGKIELIRDGQLVHVCAYDKPSITLVPVKTVSKE